MAVHSKMSLRRSAAAVALGVGAMATVGFVAPQVWKNPWGNPWELGKTCGQHGKSSENLEKLLKSWDNLGGMRIDSSIVDIYLARANNCISSSQIFAVLL